MIIPEFWAEARIEHGRRSRHRAFTVRRFGWSDESQAAAQAHADARVREAHARIVAGEPLVKREPKVPYNGAEGMPIREEIVQRHGDTIISRNSYGALCLNTPDVLFADIDFPKGVPTRLWGSVLALWVIGAIAFGNAMDSAGKGVALVIAGLFLSWPLASGVHRAWQALRGGPERMALRRVQAFVAKHPGWRLRLYRTPAGLRLLALHRRFSPGDPEVQTLFEAIGTDRLYARMCQRQQCFRARVSAKPWRIGIRRHLRPRTGVWPLTDEQRPLREAWVRDYDARAQDFAACRYLETRGDGPVDAEADAVRVLHDALAGADSGRPIA